ncbi:hypothetical protein Q5424_23755 [Conexibacter sp. JD483]|uniref:hypothetical protein n=1 Tax=unclassified Conexibacter TaxID=2627773 RepID=UPI0027251282|nr:MULTISPECIES: hypothetical protein [unclassified Conexibacter]MDO8188881.1 hypothetical protein [Conexibacter sp. CPCC 205706]MDO8201671.1 hypothetical protein [Conexibacter sp. CPCC 205762]MDR9372133.1 hypothetical protein [Conexibacter sp. JD483]
MSRIVFVLMCLTGTVHVVFFAGPQMAGLSPLVMIAFVALVAAVTIPIEHRDHKRRQRKAASTAAQAATRTGVPIATRS